MWHLQNIPKTLHTYWGGESISFIRLMTVKTFHDLNPDWNIIIHQPQFLHNLSHTWHTGEQHGFNGTNYIDELNNYPFITKSIVNFEDIGFRNDVSEVFKSDYLRWYLLSTVGGVWSDMDIIYFKSIDELSINTIENNNTHTTLCKYKNGMFNIGFLMSKPNSIVYNTILTSIQQQFNTSQYQSLGVNLLNNNLFNLNEPIVLIPPDSVYPLPVTEWSKYLQIFQPYNKNLLPIETIGIHWYAGGKLANEFEHKITHENYKNEGILLTELI